MSAVIATSDSPARRSGAVNPMLDPGGLSGETQASQRIGSVASTAAARCGSSPGCARARPTAPRRSATRSTTRSRCGGPCPGGRGRSERLVLVDAGPMSVQGARALRAISRAKAIIASTMTPSAPAGARSGQRVDRADQAGRHNHAIGRAAGPAPRADGSRSHMRNRHLPCSSPRPRPTARQRRIPRCVRRSARRHVVATRPLTIELREKH